MVRYHWSSIPFLQWWRWNTATPTENSASSPSCSWAPSTTAAHLRAATTASCGAPPPTTSMKTANMASAPTNVSPSKAFRTKPKLKSKTACWIWAFFQSRSDDFGWRESRLSLMPGISFFLQSGLWSVSFPSHCPTLQLWVLLIILYICVICCPWYQHDLMLLTAKRQSTHVQLFHRTRTLVCTYAICTEKNPSPVYLPDHFCVPFSLNSFYVNYNCSNSTAM